jgi:hypothetical protein
MCLCCDEILLKNPLHLNLRAKKRFFVDKTVSDL